jgi:hypothetical protein
MYRAATSEFDVVGEACGVHCLLRRRKEVEGWGLHKAMMFGKSVSNETVSLVRRPLYLDHMREKRPQMSVSDVQETARKDEHRAHRLYPRAHWVCRRVLRRRLCHHGRRLARLLETFAPVAQKVGNEDVIHGIKVKYFQCAVER